MGWMDWWILLPCPLCQRPAKAVFCPDCQRRLQAERLDSWPVTTSPWPLYAWGIHRGALRRAIYCLKYEGQRRIGAVLGEWLGSRWLESRQKRSGSQGSHDLLSRHDYTVVPIPLHAERLRQRGYNQAALISQAFCERTGLRHLPDALVRVRATAAQHELNPLQRQQNLAGAFALKRAPATPVLLVDDIYTTGSTVQAAQQVLVAAGIPVAGVIVVAQAQQAADRSTLPWQLRRRGQA
ncbi:competence protein ComF [Synechococcus sp. 63AY4M2]|jgi:ComF family protein|nr:competence protein ComF [Synechococcus sp. 63AY4M2]PIK92893.1 competence protein ComF [Synechococcus sp. 65AY6Li]PIK94253.1 competence protein ComF [Synechococcus sp. 60AY4M2]PIK98835.1 competence protein ComF [Synechococcus sp. 63AY4M1]PIK99353.1 competence protein ComF [Synechococcus sp. 65AY640]